MTCSQHVLQYLWLQQRSKFCYVHRRSMGYTSASFELNDHPISQDIMSGLGCFVRNLGGVGVTYQCCMCRREM